MDGGNLYRQLKNDKGGFGYVQLFFRFYMKFNKEHAPIHHYGAGFWGYNPPSKWPMGGAGIRPKGDQSWVTQVEPGNFKTWNFYSYWQEMGGSPPKGQPWGNAFESIRHTDNCCPEWLTWCVGSWKTPPMSHFSAPASSSTFPRSNCS